LKKKDTFTDVGSNDNSSQLSKTFVVRDPDTTFTGLKKKTVDNYRATVRTSAVKYPTKG